MRKVIFLIIDKLTKNLSLILTVIIGGYIALQLRDKIDELTDQPKSNDKIIVKITLWIMLIFIIIGQLFLFSDMLHTNVINIIKIEISIIIVVFICNLLLLLKERIGDWIDILIKKKIKKYKNVKLNN